MPFPPQPPKPQGNDFASRIKGPLTPKNSVPKPKVPFQKQQA